MAKGQRPTHEVARERGRQAACQGLPVEACPYALSRPHVRAMWRRGWLEARRESAGRGAANEVGRCWA